MNDITFKEDLIPVGVCTITLFGIPLNEWVYILTVVSLIITIYAKLKKLCKETKE